MQLHLLGVSEDAHSTDVRFAECRVCSPSSGHSLADGLRLRLRLSYDESEDRLAHRIRSVDMIFDTHEGDASFLELCSDQPALRHLSCQTVHLPDADGIEQPAADSCAQSLELGPLALAVVGTCVAIDELCDYFMAAALDVLTARCELTFDRCLLGVTVQTDSCVYGYSHH